MFNRPKTRLFYSFLLFFLYLTQATASDDSYLQALEAEAEASNNLQKNIQPSDSKNKQTQTDQNKLHLSQQVKHDEFSKELSKELLVTIRAYNKLTDENKQKVVDAYFNSDKNMSVATRLLFNLSFKQKTSN